MFIGIDLGTSSVKTILIDENQNTLATKTELISIENPKTFSKLVALIDFLTLLFIGSSLFAVHILNLETL